MITSMDRVYIEIILFSIVTRDYLLNMSLKNMLLVLELFTLLLNCDQYTGAPKYHFIQI